MPVINHPLRLGLRIIFCRLAICLLLGVLGYNWFGFILFLIFVGGLLVIFAYVSALRPNVYFSGKKLIYGFFFLWLFTILIFFSIYFLETTIIWENVRELTVFGKSLVGEKIVGNDHISLIVGLGGILLLNLLAVVKVCYYQQGPLRQYLD